MIERVDHALQHFAPHRLPIESLNPRNAAHLETFDLAGWFVRNTRFTRSVKRSPLDVQICSRNLDHEKTESIGSRRAFGMT